MYLPFIPFQSNLRGKKRKRRRPGIAGSCHRYRREEGEIAEGSAASAPVPAAPERKSERSGPRTEAATFPPLTICVCL